jgi:hypothetical protein
MLFERRAGAGDLTDLQRIRVRGHDFWRGKYPNFQTDRADERACRFLARQMAPLNCPVVIDIEHWPTDIRTASEEAVTESLQKLIEVLDWMRDERPTLKLGVYSLLPVRDYWVPVTYLKAKQDPSTPRGKIDQLARDYDRWSRATDFVRERLAAKVDFVCPSLYTFYDDEAGWELYARANLEESHKAGKPVYPFLWMQYHGETGVGGKFIGADVWRRQLDVCRSHADGVVIWGGWKRRWDENAPWWQATEDFVRRLESTQDRSESPAAPR